MKIFQCRIPSPFRSLKCQSLFLKVFNFKESNKIEFLTLQKQQTYKNMKTYSNNWVDYVKHLAMSGRPYTCLWKHLIFFDKQAIFPLHNFETLESKKRWSLSLSIGCHFICCTNKLPQIVWKQYQLIGFMSSREDNGCISFHLTLTFCIFQCFLCV